MNTLRDDAQRLADRYVAVWNETDSQDRARAIAELWTPDGEHYVDGQEARGYEALEKRIIQSHEAFAMAAIASALRGTLAHCTTPSLSIGKCFRPKRMKSSPPASSS